MRVVGGVLMLSGVCCAFQVFRLMMWAVWGAPTSPTQYVAFWGAVLQVIAGLVLLIGYRPALWGALIGLAMAWSFYAPALVISLGQLTVARLGAAVSAFFPPALLLGASFLTIREWFAPRRLRAGDPEREAPAPSQDG